MPEMTVGVLVSNPRYNVTRGPTPALRKELNTERTELARRHPSLTYGNQFGRVEEVRSFVTTLGEMDNIGPEEFSGVGESDTVVQVDVTVNTDVIDWEYVNMIMERVQAHYGGTVEMVYIAELTSPVR